MIQVKAVESILSSLTWSVTTPNESFKRNFFICARKKTDNYIFQVETLDIHRNDNKEPECLLNSKINLLNSPETVSGKLLNPNLTTEEQSLSKFSSNENLPNLHVVKPNHPNCKAPEELILEEVDQKKNFTIDLLKKNFERKQNFRPRIQAPGNWRPLFLNWLNEIKAKDEDPEKEIQRRISSSVLEKPRIYSIGLKYFKYQDEKNQSFLKEIRKLKSFKKEIFQIQPFSLYKSSFRGNSPKVKSESTQCSLNENATKSPNIKSSNLKEPKNRLVPLHQIEGVIKNSSIPRKRKEKVRKSTWKNVSDKSTFDKKNLNFSSRKETTSSDEEEWKNSRRRHRSLRKEKSIEKLEIILPTKNADQSIIFCEDTLTEKLNQSFSQQESVEEENIFPENYNSSFCSTELKKLDMMKKFEQMIVNQNSRDYVESEILKNIKTRIDDDFVNNYSVGKKTLNGNPDFLIEGRRKFLDQKKVKLLKVPESKKSIKICGSETADELSFNRPRSSKKDLLESVDSGVLTDFSTNDPREMSFRSRNNCLLIGESISSKEAKLWKRFPSFDSDSEGSWSNDEAQSRKIGKAVKRFTEELILCERWIKARIKSKSMLREDRDERITVSRRRRKFKKKKSKSSFVNRHTTSSQDFSKTSLPSSEEDFFLNISTPSLLSFTDSEYEKSAE
ncbi:uncharacterized protein LOC117172812 [Belonocnema kinseyi]|uniref:uncharacterized protein LOC117172812 n=1 Tax=Belonocnema kinseyi TaxID=2817044 RepID=UPI00143D3B87|nr:uncharacterized protein LOC117172812 [Belonocnema kinseyi]